MFEESISDIESGMYLGDSKVVTKLVGQFIDAIVTNANINVVFSTVNRYAEIFLGMDGAYKPVNEWNDKNHLGLDLAKRLSVSDGQSSVDLFRSAFGVFARYALTIVKESVGKDEAQVQRDVDALTKYMASVLIGTAGTLYPNNKGWEMIKSHINGYGKKDGTWVAVHENKVSKEPEILLSKAKSKPEGYHPQPNDKGQPVLIKKPSKATQADTWSNPDAVATVTPHDSKALPDSLFGVTFVPWRDAPTTLQDWANVSGQNIYDEPDFEPIKGLKQAAGVVIQEDDGRVWVIHPTNAFGGYQATFPKGTLEDCLPLQASAIKEAFEESGLKVEITGFIGDFERTTSISRYYTARRVGGNPADMGWESQGVSLVPKNMLSVIANHKSDIPLIHTILSTPR